jgi:hypothetical protein
MSFKRLLPVRFREPGSYPPGCSRQPVEWMRNLARASLESSCVMWGSVACRGGRPARLTVSEWAANRLSQAHPRWRPRNMTSPPTTAQSSER